MNKSKWLLIIVTFYLFVITFFISKSIYLFFAVHIDKWNSAIDIIAIVIFVSIILPFSVFISEKLTTFILKTRLVEKKVYSALITLLILIPIIVFSISLMNNYKTKSLEEILEYDRSSFEAIFINHQNMSEDYSVAKELLDSLVNTK